MTTDRLPDLPPFRISRGPAAWGIAAFLLVFGLGVLVIALAVPLAPAEAGYAASLLTTIAIALWLVVVMLIRPRRPRPVQTREDGTVVFRAPASVVLGLVALVVGLVLGAVLFVWAALTGTDMGTGRYGPGGLLAALLFGVPDFWRLVTGRLHWWTLEVGPERLDYRGYRTKVSVPWSAVNGARVQQHLPGRAFGRRARPGRPAGVVLDLKASRPDPLLQAALFGHHPQQIADAVNARARRSGQ